MSHPSPSRRGSSLGADVSLAGEWRREKGSIIRQALVPSRSRSSLDRQEPLDRVRRLHAEDPMGALLGLVALVVSLIAISRLHRLQREIESLRKQWLLDSLGSPRRGSAEEAGRLPVARRVPAREQAGPVLARPPDFEEVEPPKSPSPPVGASVPPDTAGEEIPFE